MKPETKADLFCATALTEMGLYDLYALMNGQETISACIRRHTEQPWQKFLLVGFMGGLTLHFLLPPINLGGHDASPET